MGSGRFAGIGVLMPFSFLGIPGATFGVDYKHIFFGSNNVTLGSAVAGREIIEHQSPDMNLFTARVTVPVSSSLGH